MLYDKRCIGDWKFKKVKQSYIIFFLKVHKGSWSSDWQWEANQAFVVEQKGTRPNGKWCGAKKVRH